MPEFATVRYSTDESVAVVTINRPDAMNSFNDQLRKDLFDALEVAANEDSIRAVIITGEGRSFVQGGN